jgi:trimeric autotransporter adhesin
VFCTFLPPAGRTLHNSGSAPHVLHKEKDMKSSKLCSLFLAALTAGFSLPLFGQSAPVSAAPARIAAPIDETNLVSLRGNVHPLAQERFDRGPAAGTTPTGRIMLMLQRSAAQQQALTQYLADVQNPSSPSYHQWLTPAQYGARFSIADSDLQTVESWLQSHGFTIERVPQARNFIEFSGTFDQLRSAFHTTIHAYSIAGQTHYANATDPQIPAALAPVVAGIGPLNDFHAHPNLVRGSTGRWNSATHRIQPELTLFNGNTPLLFVDPADAATIYDTPNKNLNANFASGGTSYDGTGVTIGIAGVSNIASQDIVNFRTGFLGESSSSVNLPNVIIDGNDPGITSAGVEALLDNEVAGGIAPGAKINLYISAGSDVSDGLFDAIFRAIDDNTVSILNVSFGECEAGEGTSGNAILLEAAEQAAAQGISETVSAGDGGSAGCDDFDTETVALYGLAVNAFASTPYTIAVGGTDFDTLPSNFGTYVNDTTSGSAPYYGTALKYIPENPWNDSTDANGLLANNQPEEGQGGTDIVGGGGGVSTVYSKPAFQNSLTPSDGARDLPDVSFFAADGMYQAEWVLCSDSVADGATGETFTDCANTNGQFSDSSIFEGVGGTSAAAPAFAGMLALVEQKTGSRLGQADYVLYQLAAKNYSTVFHDVTTGNNSVFCASGSPNCGANNFLTGYNAGTGYDLASGLGSVDASTMVSDWTGVSLTSTSTTLAINGSTAAVNVKHGTPLAFTVGVTPTAATGVVAVAGAVNENSSGPENNGQFSIPITSGAGAATWSGLPGGSYSVTARYGGDASDASSTSGGISVTISPEASATAVNVNAYTFEGTQITNLSAIPYGSYVFLDAGITGKTEGANTEGVATGTVAFDDGSTLLGTENIGVGNQASFPPNNNNYSIFAVGSHNITAKYSGDASYNASNSTAVQFTIAKAPTTTNVALSATTVNVTTSTTFSVTITTPYNLGATPTGSITISSGGTTLATISSLSVALQNLGAAYNYIISGTGTVQGSQFASGNNNITVTYTGDGNYASSSTTVSVYNTSGVGSFTLSSGGNASATTGQTANATVLITPSGGFNGPVTLTCTIPAGVDAVCNYPNSVNVSGSSAVSVTVMVQTEFGTTPGTYAISVKGVDDTGKTSSSTSFKLTVNPIPANASFTLTAGAPMTITAGEINTYAQVTITPANGYEGNVGITCSVAGQSGGSVSGGPTCAQTSATVNSNGPVVANLPITTTNSTPAGNYSISVTATDQINSALTGATTVPLTVTTPPPMPAIALSNSGNITVNAGASSGNTATVTVTPSGGFTGAVNLTCTLTTQPQNANDPAACSVPASVTISGTSAAPATFTVSTTAASSAAATAPLRKFFLGGGAVLAAVFFFGVPARRRAWQTMLGLLVAIFLISGIGCTNVQGPTGSSGGGSGGGGGSGQTIPGTTAGAYTFTVSAVDAITEQLHSTTTITVTVN